MSLFNNVSMLTKEQIVAKQVDDELKKAAVAMLQSYKNVRRIIYSNPVFKDEYGAFDANAVYEAWAMNTTSGLTPEQLGQFARATKALINQAARGKVVDNVPEATITY